MNDLRKLIGSSTESDGEGRPLAQAPADIAALRDLVGASVAVSRGQRAASESAQLKALVGGGESASPPSSSRPLGELTGLQTTPSRDAHGALSAIVGDARHMPSSDSRAALSRLVGDGGKSAEDAGWRAPELAQVGKRPLFGGRRRAGAINYLSVAAAILAVVAIVGTASFAVVQRATANPADDAMIGLREREAELANDTKVLQTAADLYGATLAEASTLAQASESVFAALDGRVDPAPLAAAATAREGLVQTAATAAPVSVPRYQRASIDEKSLVEVGNAIDGVRAARESLPALISDARDSRAQVVAGISALRSALKAIGSAILTDAEKIAAQNSSAARSFRTAVTDAAARVTAAQQDGGDGLAEMPVFAAAVDALRAENQRVLGLEDAARSRTPTQPSTRNPGSGGSSNSGGSNPSPSPSPSASAPQTPSAPPAAPPQEDPTPDASQSPGETGTSGVPATLELRP